MLSLRSLRVRPLSLVLLMAAAYVFVVLVNAIAPEPAPNARVLRPLNVRAGPGTGFPVVGHAAEGSEIRIARPNAEGWALVRRGRRHVGYVRALPQYVRMIEPHRSGGWISPWFLLMLGVAGAGVLLVLRREGRARAPIAPAPRRLDAWDDDRTLPAPYPAYTAAPVYAPPPAAWDDRAQDTPVQHSDETEAERNGRDFEKWAAVRLGRAPFHLLEWRGDKYVEGVYAESTLAPDLVVEYREGRERIRFAVECKWRSRYWDDGLRWGEWKHLHRYRRYAAENRIQVYLLLGVGGIGAAPREVYLVPLEDVPSPTLFLRELRAADQVEGDGAFEFDFSHHTLRLRPA